MNVKRAIAYAFSLVKMLVQKVSFWRPTRRSSASRSRRSTWSRSISAPRRLILQVAFLRWKHRSTFPTSRSFARIARSPRASTIVVRTARRFAFAISVAKTSTRSSGCGPKSSGCTSSERFLRTLRWTKPTWSEDAIIRSTPKLLNKEAFRNFKAR